MALMHQLLYERADFSGLDLGFYLRRLAGLLRDTYLGASSPLRLQVHAPDTGVRMDLQRAIPCACWSPSWSPIRSSMPSPTARPVRSACA